MNPSSTSSSDQPKQPWVRRPWTFCAVLVMVVVVGELLFRGYQPVPYSGGWANPEVESKVSGARRVKGPVDLLIMGSSIGLTPNLQGWKAASGDRLQAYNGSVPGLRVAEGQFLVRKVLHPILKPRRVLYLLHPRDINAMGRPWSEYGRSGYFFNSPAYRAWDDSNFFTGTLRRAILRSRLWEGRGTFRTRIQKGLSPSEDGFLFDAWGTGQMAIGQLDNSVPPPSLRNHYLSTGPNRKFSVDLEGELNQLVQLHQWLRDQGSELFVADFPLPEAAQHTFEDYPSAMEKYRGALAQLKARGITVLPPSNKPEWPSHYYYDHSHMNRMGAAIYSRELWKQIAPILGFAVGSTRELDRSIPTPEIRSVASVLDTTDGAKLRLVDWSQMAPSAGIRSELQVLVSKGTVHRTTLELGPGHWSIDLYHPKPGPEVGPNKGQFQLLASPAGPSSLVFGLEPTGSVQALVRNYCTNYKLESATSMTLAIKWKPSSNNPAEYGILDSICILPDPNSLAESKSESGTVFAPSRTENPLEFQMAGLDFDLNHPTTKTLAMGWEPYTGTRDPWGGWSLQPDSRGGHQALVSWSKPPQSWGNSLIYSVGEKALTCLEGTTVTAGIWIKPLNREDEFRPVARLDRRSSAHESISTYLNSGQQDLRLPAEVRERLIREGWIYYSGAAPIAMGDRSLNFIVGTSGGPVLLDEGSLTGFLGPGTTKQN